MADIVAYFRGIGIEVTPRITLRFADRAIVRSAERASVHGYFDGQQADSFCSLNMASTTAMLAIFTMSRMVLPS